MIRGLISISILSFLIYSHCSNSRGIDIISALSSISHGEYHITANWDSLFQYLQYNEDLVQKRIEISLIERIGDNYNNFLIYLTKKDDQNIVMRKIRWRSTPHETRSKCDLIKMNPVTGRDFCLYDIGFEPISISKESLRKIEDQLLKIEKWTEDIEDEDFRASIYIEYYNNGRFQSLHRTNTIEASLSRIIVDVVNHGEKN